MSWTTWEQGWHSGESTQLPPMWPSSNPSIDAICGLILLLVFSLCSERCFSGYSCFSLSLQTSLPNSNSIWNAQFTCFNEFLRTCKSSVGKQIIIFVTIIELQGCTVLAVILRHIQCWFGWSLNPWPPAQQPCAHPIYHTCKKNVQLSNKRVLFRTFEDSFSLQMSSSSQGRLHLLLSLQKKGWWMKLRSQKILAGSRNLGSVFDKSRSLVFAWFVFTFFESRNFLPKSLRLGFLTTISVSRRVSDFTIRHL